MILKDFILAMAKYNNPVDKMRLRKIAKKYAVICDIKINDDKWCPGEDWLKG